MFLLVKTIKLYFRPILWLAWITFLCLVPTEDIPGAGLINIPGFDKLVHFGMYFVLAVLLYRPFILQHLPPLPLILLVTVIVGGLIELLQLYLTSYRSASLYDFLADLAGAASGWWAYWLMIKGKSWERYF